MNISDSAFDIESPLALLEDEVHLWRADLDAVAHDESRWQRALSSDEMVRAARFHFARDRQRFTAARAILRSILAGYLATDANNLSFSYSNKEKPSLAPAHAGTDLMFNISHSCGTALLAFTRSRDIGVDVEQIRSDFELEAIARRFFSALEQKQLAEFPAEERVAAFFRCWTRKEAYIKATGDGLSLPLSQFDVSLAAGKKDALVATRPDDAERQEWRLQEVAAGAGCIGALCVRGKEWKLVDWSGSG